MYALKIPTLCFSQVLELAADVLKRVPEEIDYEQTAKIMSDDPSPLNVVLLQEVTICVTMTPTLFSPSIDLGEYLASMRRGGRFRTIEIQFRARSSFVPLGNTVAMYVYSTCGQHVVSKRLILRWN